MKKSLILLMVLILTGCAAQTNVQETPPPEDNLSTAAPGSIQEYFPIKTNTFYEFESPDTADLNQQVYVTYAQGSRIQRRVSTAKSASTEIMEYAGGQLKLIYGDPAFYFYENLLGVEPTMNFVIMKEPLQVGQKWQMSDDLSAEITSMDADVSTPLGSYKTMEITSTYVNGQKQTEYYAPGIGLVKTVYSSVEHGDLEFSLVRMTEKAALNVPADVYFPSGQVLQPEQKTLEISTNCDLPAVLTEAMGNAADGGTALMPSGAKINSIAVDRTKDGVRIDLSKDFVSAMDASGGAEPLILQGIAETLCGFYDTSQVHVTVDGGAYQSKNTHMGPEDWLKAKQPEPQDAGSGDGH